MRFVPAALAFAFGHKKQPPSSAAAASVPARAWRANPTWQIAAGGALVVAVVVATTWLLLTNLRNEQIEQNEGDLESMTLVVAEQIDRNFRTIELIQNGVIARMHDRGIEAAVEFESDMSDFSTHRYLKEQITAQPYIDAILITNPDGKLVNTTRSWPVEEPPQNKRPTSTAVRDTPDQALLIGQLRRNDFTGEWILPFARRLTNARGEHLGSVIGLIRAQYFEDYFKTVARNRDRSIALFKRDGTPVVRYPTDESLLRTSFAKRAIFADVLAQRTFGTVRQSSLVDDSMLLISGRVLPNYPMAIVVTRNIDAVLASWRYAATYASGAALVIAVVIGAVVTLVTRRIRRDLEARNIRQDAALNNMSQGLTMFDSSNRLIVCNERYRDMYKLPPEAVQPGIFLSEVLRLRAAAGTSFTSYEKDPQEYLNEAHARIATRKPYSFVRELPDGRIISVSHRTSPDGSWVATHEDITDLRRREESFRLLFDDNPMPMWVNDLDNMHFLAVNDAALRHYGYTREEFMALTAIDLVEEEDRSIFLARKTDATVKPGERLIRHRKADGSIIDVSVYFRIMEYKGHRASLIAVQDITSRKAAEDELRRTQSFLNAIVENVPAPIFVKKIGEGSVQHWPYTLINRATEDFLGISRDYVIGKTPADLFPQEQAGLILDVNNDTFLSGEPVSRSDHLIDTFLNGQRLVTSRSAAVRDHNQKPLYLLTVLEDVTEQRRVEQGIARMAHYDALTDLPNRMTFNESIDTAIEMAARTNGSFGLLSLDLDGFKEANDTYGHAVGDALLREVAGRLQAAAADAFVARIGGDEFTILVETGPQPATAAAVAERLIACIGKTIDIEDRRINISATVGGAIYPNDGADAKTLLINADVALYRAKAAARGSVVFYEPSMGEQLRERRALQDELRAAVQNDELLLHYQPQFTMSGATVGFEALVRWQSPKRGLVSPAQFIPLAEETGLISPLGNWVLREACRDAAQWPVPLTVAVNVSPAQFRAGDLAQNVQSALMETGLAPARLEIEITENVLIDDFSRAISILCRLKALGVRIALDDFGSGYSSLSYLHSFSFDKIKIDRTFIGDLESNRHSKAIVRAVIDLGHSLSVPILAEGVETPAQHALLERSGCDEVQGYLTGRPAPIAQYRNLTESRQPQKIVQAAAL